MDADGERCQSPLATPLTGIAGPLQDPNPLAQRDSARNDRHQ